MTVTIHQPAYLPWIGYFHKIYLSDVFVYFDTTQFEKNSFINRNKIKTAQGSSWLTVPVKLKDHFEKEIREIELGDQKWKKTHWKTIEFNYKKAKYWGLYSKELEELYNRDYNNISDVCYEQLLLIIKWLEIDVKIIKSSDLKEYNSRKHDLILEICKDLNTDLYISGKLGKDYIIEKDYEEAGIELYYQDYIHPKYNQLWGEGFVSYMSIIDLLFNEGPESMKVVLKGNMKKRALLRV